MSFVNIYRKICSVVQNGSTGVLATIIKTRGSTPASALSKMVILDGGANIVGTIGGGCVEAQVITESKEVYKSGILKRSSYSLTEDDIDGGLICGGTVDIMLELLHIGMLPVFKTLIDRSIEGQDSVLGTLSSGTAQPQKFLITDNGDTVVDAECTHVDVNLTTYAQEVISSGNTVVFQIEDSEIVLEPVSGMYSIVLFGGGHVSKFVAEIAHQAGFSVIVVDDRLKYVSKKRFPTAEKTICADFKKSFNQLQIHAKTALVIVTRGHSYDETVLEQALKTDAGYIGMIGSRRKITKSYDNLVEKGVSAEQLKHVFAPLGLEIGAQSAGEIAVSIVAELVKWKRDHSVQGSPHFRDSMQKYFEKKGL